jgi:hypothetical protein
VSRFVVTVTLKEGGAVARTGVYLYDTQAEAAAGFDAACDAAAEMEPDDVDEDERDKAAGMTPVGDQGVGCPCGYLGGPVILRGSADPSCPQCGSDWPTPEEN